MFGRALRVGLSSLRDRAAARLAGSRFNPSRAVAIAVGGALSSIGYYLQKPGEVLSNIGIEITYIGCPCPMCKEQRRRKRNGRKIK